MTPCFRALALLAPMLLSGCAEEAETAAKPAPRELTREAVGYYCNMIVADHAGPKAQLFLHGEAVPLWFSSVRDAVAFTLLPEEPKRIAAIYVNDMGVAAWDAPEPGTWIEAETARYVIGSRMHGGMGAREAVPFADPAAAEAFAERHGGRAVGFAEIPQDYILAADEDAPHGAPDAAAHTHETETGHGTTH